MLKTEWAAPPTVAGVSHPVRWHTGARDTDESMSKTGIVKGSLINKVGAGQRTVRLNPALLTCR